METTLTRNPLQLEVGTHLGPGQSQCLLSSSLPPEVLGVIFKGGRCVLDSMAVCKQLGYMLPQHAHGLTLQIKEYLQLFKVRVQLGFTTGNVVRGTQRFRSTPGLWLLLHHREIELSLDSLQKVIPEAGWVDNGWGSSVSTREHALPAARAFHTVAVGVDCVLGQGVLSTLTALEISIDCNTDNIVSVVRASSQTLQAVSLTGDCKLDTSEIQALGLVLQQCAKLGSFTLSNMNPKDVWDDSLALHSPHGAAVIKCTTKLIKASAFVVPIQAKHFSLQFFTSVFHFSVSLQFSGLGFHSNLSLLFDMSKQSLMLNLPEDITVLVLLKCVDPG
jgi:hypothetical protein